MSTSIGLMPKEGELMGRLNTKAEVRLNVREVEDKLGWPAKLVDAMTVYRTVPDRTELIYFIDPS